MEVSWINKEEYPFNNHYLDIQNYNMHYVDEGKENDSVILMIHGTPVWSFLYRNLIKQMRSQYRCIAPDLLGFGLSDKNKEIDFSFESHANRLIEFVNKLNLNNIHLVTQDLGGPIALFFAENFPEKIRTITISNSFSWSLKGVKQFEPTRYFHGTIGKFLYLNMNFSLRFMVPKSFGNKNKLTNIIYQHYLSPFKNIENRHSTYSFVKSMLLESPWLEKLYTNTNSISNKPSLILWGMKDIFFPYELMIPKWKEIFPNATIVKFNESGHFIEEEEPEQVFDTIQNFIYNYQSSLSTSGSKL